MKKTILILLATKHSLRFCIFSIWYVWITSQWGWISTIEWKISESRDYWWTSIFVNQIREVQSICWSRSRNKPQRGDHNSQLISTNLLSISYENMEWLLEHKIQQLPQRWANAYLYIYIHICEVNLRLCLNLLKEENKEENQKFLLFDYPLKIQGKVIKNLFHLFH